MEPPWSPWLQPVASGGKSRSRENGSQEGVNLERGPTMFDAPQPLGREARVEREVEVGVGAAVDQGWARTRRISRVAHRTRAMRAGACRSGLGALRLGSAQGSRSRSGPSPHPSLLVVLVVAADPHLERVALVAAFRCAVENRVVAH